MITCKGKHRQRFRKNGARKRTVRELSLPIQQTMTFPADTSAEITQEKERSSNADEKTVNVAVVSKHSLETTPVVVDADPLEPQIIEVQGGDLPVEIHFKSSTSSVKVHQSHFVSQPMEPKYEHFDETPERLITKIHKPVIQEVREIIMPYRKVLQEITPVQEEIRTIVTQNKRNDAENRHDYGYQMNSFSPKTNFNNEPNNFNYNYNYNDRRPSQNFNYANDNGHYPGNGFKDNVYNDNLRNVVVYGNREVLNFSNGGIFGSESNIDNGYHYEQSFTDSNIHCPFAKQTKKINKNFENFEFW